MSAEIDATKFYIRHRDQYPDSDAQGAALEGMRPLNVETQGYQWVDDIDAFSDLGPTVGVAGYIGDVHRALKVLGKPIPDNVDYPAELEGYLGREIRKGTLADVRRSPGVQVFVKPQEHKAFSGFVWDGGAAARRRVVTQDDDTPVFLCDPIDIVVEYRSFILYGQVIDCRKYKGDWSVAPDRETVVKAPKALGKKAPHAYCLDWGVTAEGKTILIEANEGYSFGHYGLPAISYARMLSARWMEMAS